MEKYEMEEKLKSLEKIKNDGTKYYQALREMKRIKSYEKSVNNLTSFQDSFTSKLFLFFFKPVYQVLSIQILIL